MTLLSDMLHRQEAITQEKDAFIERLYNESDGDTLAGAFALGEDTHLTLLVESTMARKEFLEDLGLTIIYREPPFSAGTFRGRTLVGCIYRERFLSSDAGDALRGALNLCKMNDIPVHVSH